ncbi:MAG: alkaline phosphatase [Bryobacteraceae bacterium]|nr:alkaline phosphatase [Bryobacteraceae bacterium]
MKRLFVTMLLTAGFVCPAPKPRYVVLIGIDGLGSAGLSAALRAGRAPRIAGLVARGSWSPAGRGVIPTVSSPNWASILMGAGPERHGITSNEWERDKREIPPSCQGTEEIFPTIVGAVRQQLPKAKIGVVHDWAGFARLIERGAADYVSHPKGSRATAEEAARYWQKERPRLLLVHFDDVDHAGHDMGWETKEYAQAVADMDGYVGTVLDAIDPANTLVVLTADHGGVGKKHGGLSKTEIEVPILFAGPGVAKGKVFARPLGNIDIAPGILKLLGLRAPPCWTGRAPEF